MSEQVHTPLIDWAVATLALEGEEESGDLHVVAPFSGGVLVGVIDGLGHGPEAAVAARNAAETLLRHPHERVENLLERCHQGLRGTRGAVITLASFSERPETMTWLGVGNIEGTLLRADPGDARPRESVMLMGGVPGHQLPGLRTNKLELSAGDTLILATDGIRGGYLDLVSPSEAPQKLADQLLSDYGKGTDDALVLVARYRGAAA
ncbi:MAG TPA: SpoIIE family protein phosphatase [Thermoleophilaceae bacterium]